MDMAEVDGRKSAPSNFIKHRVGDATCQVVLPMPPGPTILRNLVGSSIDSAATIRHAHIRSRLRAIWHDLQAAAA